MGYPKKATKVKKNQACCIKMAIGQLWDLSAKSSLMIEVKMELDFVVKLINGWQDLSYSELPWDLAENPKYPNWRILTLKDEGGCPKVTAGREIVCHFFQSHAMVTKNLGFIHICTSQLEGSEVLTGFLEIQPRPIRNQDFLVSVTSGHPLHL